MDGLTAPFAHLILLILPLSRAYPPTDDGLMPDTDRNLGWSDQPTIIL